MSWALSSRAKRAKNVDIFNAHDTDQLGHLEATPVEEDDAENTEFWILTTETRTMNCFDNLQKYSFKMHGLQRL